MKVIEVEFSPYEAALKANAEDSSPQLGEWVLIETEKSKELGKIIKIKESDDSKAEEMNSTLIRLADRDDLQTQKEFEKNKNTHSDIFRSLLKKYHLAMKFVDLHYSFEGERVTFYFAAKERVDFRNLLKELSSKLHKAIRLEQISSRYEAKNNGSLGACGRELCCRSFLKKLGGVSTEYIYDQQLGHRGIERVSGMCGRLRCCLAYEEDLYKELSKDFPPVGSSYKCSQGKGEVIGWHVLKKTIDVKLDDKNIVEVAIKK